MTTKEINTLSIKYIAQTIFIIVALSAIAIGLICTLTLNSIVAPLILSVVFSFVVEVAEALVWRKVMISSKDSITTFYTVVSGFRMLLALFTLLICCIIVGRDSMFEYCIVFITFYFVLLIHHAIFFSHVSNSNNSVKQ